MKKIVMTLAALAVVAGSAFVVNQAVAKQVATCFCTPQYGCSCENP
jgi:hypothetical protein